MVYTRTIMSLEHIHDFYFLQALEFGVLAEIQKNPERGFLRSVEKLQEDIHDAQADIYPKIALRLFLYLYVACLGESRHALTSEAQDYFIPQTRGLARDGLYMKGTDYRPNTHNIETLIKVFDQKWCSGFGGRAWKAIAESLLMYGKQSDVSFIDHIVDLEHNNGTAFSKSDAKRTIKFDVSYPARFSSFLDYKFHYNILERAFGECLKLTPRVFSLVSRYAMIFNKREISWVKPKLVELDDYYIYWKDEMLSLEKKWMPGANVGLKNKPTPKDILALSKIDDIHPKNMTYKDFKKLVMEKVEPNYAVFEKKDLPSAKQYVKNYIESRLPYLKKVAKYTLLPCSVTKAKSGYVIEVPIHFNGAGKRTANGTAFKTSHWMTIPSTQEGLLHYESGMIILLVEGKKYSITPGELFLIMGG